MPDYNPDRAIFFSDAKLHRTTESDKFCTDFQTDYKIDVVHPRYVTDSTHSTWLIKLLFSVFDSTNQPHPMDTCYKTYFGISKEPITSVFTTWQIETPMQISDLLPLNFMSSHLKNTRMPTSTQKALLLCRLVEP